VVYVSHDRDEVARLADHLLLMQAGHIVAAGAIADMLTRVDLPLVQGGEAEAIIEARVSGHDDEFQLTFLDSPAGSFTVTGRGVDVGADVRLRILAKDVSLTLVHQSDTSILNIFPATIDDMVPEGAAQMTVRLLVGEAPILARITRKSADNLGLSPGMEIFAQMKSVALLA
jgi:molybdate transport system ATP-binding protein